MQKALIVGDSLSGGLPHVNFWMRLKKMADGYNITARAMGGDPLGGVFERVKRLLPKVEPDILIIQAGGNDIFLPALRARGGNWSRLVKLVEKRGHLPIEDVREFSKVYSRMAEEVSSRIDRVIVTTIICLGEDLSSEPNRRRREYNDAIREIAGRYDLVLADTAKAFDDILEGLDNPSHYFLDSFYHSFTDIFHTLTPRSIDRLSGRRGLVLTLDGAHFNRLGARIYAQVVHDAMTGV
jgi:lysophospholipase L1-like esterase